MFNIGIDYIRKSVIKFASADNFKESLFVFQKVYLNKIKIYFMKASGLIFVSISDDRVKAHYCKLYLLHMYIAFINFNGDLIEKVKLIKLNDKNKISNNELNDFFEFKIYEVYFVKYLTNHFERVFRHIIKKEEMYLSYIKFKNMYVVDLSSQEILFDMSAIRNSKKNKKIYKNEKLWMELMHHSRSLMEAYITQCDYEFTMQDSLYRVRISQLNLLVC